MVLPNNWSVRHDSLCKSASMSTNTRDQFSKQKTPAMRRKYLTNYYHKLNIFLEYKIFTKHRHH